MPSKSDFKRQKEPHQQSGVDYTSQVLRLFVEVRKCRMGRRDDPQVIIDEIKNFDKPRTEPFSPLVQYVLSNIKMNSTVLEDIRYVIRNNQSLLDEVKEAIEIFASYVFKLGNVVCYNFLKDDCGFVVDPIDELSLASLHNNYELVNYFVTQKFYDVNAVKEGGEAPLVTAVDRGYARLTRLFLENDADISVQKEMKNVFVLAIYKGHLLTLTELVEFQNRSDNHITNILDEDGYTLIHKAIDYNQERIVAYLLDFFGKDLKDPNDLDLVIYACTENNYEMAEYLVKNYPDNFSYATLSKDDNTILHHTSHGDDTFAVAKSLLDKKQVDITKQNKSGNTFLHIAARYVNIVILNYYLHLYRENKAQSIVNLENADGKTIGQMLLQADQKILLVEYINDTDLNLLQKNKHGTTLLEEIVASGDQNLIFFSLIKIQNTNKVKRKLARSILFKPNNLMQSINFLILVGVVKSNDLSQSEERITEWVYAEQTPLHLICEKLSFIDIQSMVAKHNFDINTKNAKRCSVLAHMLINARFTEARQFIEAYQPSLEDLDNLGSSLLHLACELKNVELVEYSLSRNLSPLTLRQKGVNAIDIAINLNNQQIVTVLWAKLAVNEQLDYFVKTSDNNKQFLQAHNIYQIAIHVKELRELVLAQYLSEVTELLAKEELSLYVDNLKAQAEQKYEQELDNVSERLVNTLIGQCVKDIEQEKAELVIRAAVESKYKEMLTELDARIAAAKLAHQKLSLKNKYNSDNLLKAVREKDYNYFRDLPIDNAEILQAVSECAVQLMLNAIAMRDQQLCIFLLNIRVIEAQIHSQNNIVYNTARDHGLKDVISRLSSIAAVQKERIPKDGKIQQVHGLVPRCSFNPNYRLVINELTRLLNTDKYRDLELYVCGSGVIKYSPQDLDLISPGSESTFTRHLVFSLLEDIVLLGAKVDKDATDNQFGYLSPKVKPDRRVIQVEWWNCKLEFVLIKQTLAHHAYNSYAKVTALYFCLRQLKMLEVDGVGSIADLHGFTIDSTIEPMLSFTVDFNRIFKLIILSVTSQANPHLVNGCIPSLNYDLSNRVIQTIVEMFSTNNNPFFSYNMMMAKLRPRLASIFAYDNPFPIIRALYDLKILPHLLDYLHSQKGEHARAYRDSLIDISDNMDKHTMTVIQQQRMHIYNVRPVIASGNYDPRVFQAAPPSSSSSEVPFANGDIFSQSFVPGGNSY